MTFADDTAVEGSGNHWNARVAPGWDVVGNANGGYLMAIAGRAMIASSGRPDPVTLTAHFLRPVAAGPVTVTTETLRAGRRFTTLRATLGDDSGPSVALLGTFGDLTTTAGPRRVDVGPPDLPPPDECVRVVPSDPFPPPITGMVDLRLHPEDAAFFAGTPSGFPRLRGWFRLPDDEPMDCTTMLLAVDAFPPTAFTAGLPVGWTPTIELTAHLRARPAPGWLRCAFSTRFVTEGFLEEDGEVWDETGKIVAQSRQLALVARA